MTVDFGRDAWPPTSGRRVRATGSLPVPAAPQHECRERQSTWHLAAAALALLAAALPDPLAAQHAAPPAPVTVRGNGSQTYVLLSGAVGGIAGFRQLETRLLTRGHRVVVVDPYNLSLDSADVTFDALARRVDRELAARGVRAARVVGHSYGGGVALRLAANAPARVERLYLLDVGALSAYQGRVLTGTLRLVPLISRLPGGRALVRSWAVRGLRQNSGNPAWLVDSVRRAYTEPMLDDIDRVVALALRLRHAVEPEPMAAVLARVRVPVTVLLGGIACPAGPEPGEVEALEPLGRLLRIERLPGVGHFVHEEAPDEVVRHLSATESASSARGMGGDDVGRDRDRERLRWRDGVFARARGQRVLTLARGAARRAGAGAAARGGGGAPRAGAAARRERSALTPRRPIHRYAHPCSARSWET